MPCELWFLNRAKPEHHRDKVLMIDARNVYRKVTRKIYDFSHEQRQNLQAIVWLYRGDTDRFLDLVSRYLGDMADEGLACIEWEDEDGETVRPVPAFLEAVDALQRALTPFLKTQAKTGPHAEPLAEFREERKRFAREPRAIPHPRRQGARRSGSGRRTPAPPSTSWWSGSPRLAEASHDLAGTDRSALQAGGAPDRDLREGVRRQGPATPGTAATSPAPARPPTRHGRSSRRRTSRSRCKPGGSSARSATSGARPAGSPSASPGAELRDVEGLVKLVDRVEIEANDWSLTPGRYVGVAPEEEDEDFDFGETMRAIHAELEEHNAEAATLAATIKKNFEALGI